MFPSNASRSPEESKQTAGATGTPPANAATNVALPGTQPIQDATPPLENNGLIGMTSSQLLPEKVHLPKGLFIIAAIGAFFFAASFFDTSQNSFIYTMLILLNLLVVIGLFLRLEAARKITIGLSVVTVILSTVFIVLFTGLLNRYDQLKLQSEAAFAQLESQRLTTNQRQQLDAMQARIEVMDKQLGRSLPLVYAKYGVTIIAYSGVAIYLARPKVKGIFRSELNSPR